MRGWLGVVVLLAGCDVVFGLDEPNTAITVRIVQDRRFIHDTVDAHDVVDIAPYASAVDAVDVRTGDTDLPVATRYEDGAVLFEIEPGTSYRALVGAVEVQGIAGEANEQTLPVFLAGSEQAMRLPVAPAPSMRITELPPQSASPATRAQLVTTGLWQATRAEVIPAAATSVLFELATATRLSASEPRALPEPANGDASYFLERTGFNTLEERISDAWTLPPFTTLIGDGRTDVPFNSLGRETTEGCTELTVDTPGILARFDALGDHTGYAPKAAYSVMATPSTDYFIDGFLLYSTAISTTAAVVDKEIRYRNPFRRERPSELVAYLDQPPTGARVGVFLTLPTPEGSPNCDSIVFEGDGFAIPSIPTLNASVLDGATVPLGAAPLVPLRWDLASPGLNDYFLVLLYDVTTGAGTPVRSWLTREAALDLSSSLFAEGKTYQLYLFAIAGVPTAAELQFTQPVLPLARAFVQTATFEISRQ